MILGTFLNVSGGELVIIALLALIVLGPERLPVAIRKVGQVTGQLRALSDSFKREIESVTDFTPEPIVKPQPRHLQAVETSKSDAAKATPAQPAEDGAQRAADADAAFADTVTNQVAAANAVHPGGDVAEPPPVESTEKPVSPGGPSDRTFAFGAGEHVTPSPAKPVSPATPSTPAPTVAPEAE